MCRWVVFFFLGHISQVRSCQVYFSHLDEFWNLLWKKTLKLTLLSFTCMTQKHHIKLYKDLFASRRHHHTIRCHVILLWFGCTFLQCHTNQLRGKEPTIADHQEHERLVSQQPQDRSWIGVLLGGDVPGSGLCLSGRNLWFILEHWKQTHDDSGGYRGICDIRCL